MCHRLESSSRLPAPTTCTPLEINQHTSESRLVSLVSAAKASLQRWERAMSGPGDSGISEKKLGKEIKLLGIQVALQTREREVGLAEAAPRGSYAKEVYGLNTF